MMVDYYDYEGLNEKSKQFAMHQLKENLAEINGQIEKLRHLIRASSHLTCPIDSRFLLQFLRLTNYDEKEALKFLDNYCTLRKSPRGSPQFFNFDQISDSDVEEFLSLRIVTPLGKNDNDELILYISLKNWDPDKISKENLATLAFAQESLITSQEEIQIQGLHFVVDLTNASFKIAKAISDPSFLTQVYNLLQYGIPWKLRTMAYISDSKLFNMFFQILLWILNDEYKALFRLIRKDDQKAIDDIPGLRNLLPVESGGLNPSWSEITEQWNTEFWNFYKNPKDLNCICVDESKRTKETSKNSAECPVYREESFDSAYPKGGQ